MDKAVKFLEQYGTFDMAVLEVNEEYLNGSITQTEMLQIMDALCVLEKKGR